MRNEAFHGFSVLSQDITSRKQYERMLERQNDRLKEFTDILSHDLCNPLNVVGARLDLYRQTGDESHPEIAEENTERMEGLIDDLPDVARQGDMVTGPQPVHIESVVEQAKMGTLPHSASVEYHTVPPVIVDEDRHPQVFENHLRNAAERAGSDVTVTVGPLDNGLYVEDDGPGIPEGLRDEVFDHGVTTDSDGTGFGLSIVRTIVYAHGWDTHATGSGTGAARLEVTGSVRFEE